MPSRILFAAALVAVFALAAFAVVDAPAATAAGDCTADGSLDAEEKAFLALINNHRAQNGAAALGVSYTLSKAAQWKSQDMGANGYFAHNDLNRTWVDRIRDCGYGYNTSLGENIAAGVSSAQSAFNLWKNSSGHNANMLNAGYRTIGIGRAYTAGSPYGWYWTTEFGGVDDGYVTVAAPRSAADVAPALDLIVTKRRDGSLALRVTGRDAARIVRVEFAADGVVFATDTRAPYASRTGRGVARGTITAKVYDAAGKARTLYERSN
jgi:uncharacterized protein YkwD